MTREALAELVAKYRHRGLLLDTPLLLAVLLTAFGRRHERAWQRVMGGVLQPRDGNWLATFATEFKVQITTPHILTEVSNLAGKIDQRLHRDFRAVLAEWVIVAREENMAASEIVRHPGFPHLGLADTAIEMLAADRYLVATTDFGLAGRLRKRGCDVLNFAELLAAGLM